MGAQFPFVRVQREKFPVVPFESGKSTVLKAEENSAFDIPLAFLFV
jgi:hypothetical protein